MRKREIQIGQQYRLKRVAGGKFGRVARVAMTAPGSAREAIGQSRAYVPDGIVTVSSVGWGSAMVTDGTRTQSVNYGDLFPVDNENPHIWREAMHHPAMKWTLYLTAAAFVVGIGIFFITGGT